MSVLIFSLPSFHIMQQPSQTRYLYPVGHIMGNFLVALVLLPVHTFKRLPKVGRSCEFSLFMMPVRQVGDVKNVA